MALITIGGLKKMDVFAKIKEIIDNAGTELGFNHLELFQATQKLSNKWHYTKSEKIQLNQKEVMLYEWYLNNNYNPSTIYKWMLLIKDAPVDVKEQLARGQIGISKAREMVKEYKQLNCISEQEFVRLVADNINRYLIR